ncbi:hypothetical protein FBZ82_106352 [Azospirillum brasilense]|uniref:Uncharacterized protein n=1 Tax=Azospirillum brasilense TaxID=192 RepID=A0A560B6H9_AZOBR|nr:hypothetical protein [Azospirillum brasilense]MBK3732929.1 hypothetical protein [Azospirillum brasilense]TWA68227.1 hypothetical protein FBZ82_106352 [Azospirillum brasilense]TWA81460.1 hypothetical protein FBZ83_108352 [Azospirillum brasilense]
MQALRQIVIVPEQEDDLVAEAIRDVCVADVIDQATKDRLVDGLTVLKAGLPCTDAGCTGCVHRRSCERFIESILWTS